MKWKKVYSVAHHTKELQWEKPLVLTRIECEYTDYNGNLKKHNLIHIKKK